MTQLEKEFSALRKAAEKDFRSESWRGALQYQRTADIRYRGQGYELNVPFTRNLMDAFHREHHRRYGYSHPEREVELVTLRLRTTMRSPQANLASSNAGRSALARAGRTRLGNLPAGKNVVLLRSERAPVFFGGRKIETTIYARDALQPGKKYSGPAVIAEYSATTVVPPGMQFQVDRASNLLIAIR